MLKKFISILCAATMVASGAVVSVGAAPKEDEIKAASDREKNNLSGEEKKETKVKAKKTELNNNGGKSKRIKEIQTKTENEKKKNKKKLNNNGGENKENKEIKKIKTKTKNKKKEEKFWDKMARELEEGKLGERKKVLKDRREQQQIGNDYLNNLRKKREEKLKKEGKVFVKRDINLENDDKEQIKEQIAEHHKDHNAYVKKCLSKHFEGYDKLHELYRNNKEGERKACMEFLKNCNKKLAKSEEEILEERKEKFREKVNKNAADIDKLFAKAAKFGGPTGASIMCTVRKLNTTRNTSLKSLLKASKEIDKAEKSIVKCFDMSKGLLSKLIMLDNMRKKVLKLAEESKNNDEEANERLIEIFSNNSDFPGFAEEFAGKEFKNNLEIALKGIKERKGECDSLQKYCDNLIKQLKNREKARREKYDRVYNSLFGSLENLECRVEDEIKEINERIKAFEAGQKNREKGDIKNEDINYEEEDNNQFNNMNNCTFSNNMNNNTGNDMNNNVNMNNNQFNNNNYYPNDYMNQNMIYQDMNQNGYQNIDPGQLFKEKYNYLGQVPIENEEMNNNINMNFNKNLNDINNNTFGNNMGNNMGSGSDLSDLSKELYFDYRNNSINITNKNKFNEFKNNKNNNYSYYYKNNNNMRNMNGQEQYYENCDVKYKEKIDRLEQVLCKNPNMMNQNMNINMNFNKNLNDYNNNLNDNNNYINDMAPINKKRLNFGYSNYINNKNNNKNNYIIINPLNNNNKNEQYEEEQEPYEGLLKYDKKYKPLYYTNKGEGEGEGTNQYLDGMNNMNINFKNNYSLSNKNLNDYNNNSNNINPNYMNQNMIYQNMNQNNNMNNINENNEEVNQLYLTNNEENYEEMDNNQFNNNEEMNEQEGNNEEQYENENNAYNGEEEMVQEGEEQVEQEGNYEEQYEEMEDINENNGEEEEEIQYNEEEQVNEEENYGEEEQVNEEEMGNNEGQGKA